MKVVPNIEDDGGLESMLEKRESRKNQISSEIEPGIGKKIESW